MNWRTYPEISGIAHHNGVRLIFSCAVWLFPLLLSSPGLAVEVFFSPGKDCENQIISAINNAKTEVVSAVYSINNKRIVEALISAHKRGIKVRVLTDRTQAAGPSSKVPELVDAGVMLRVHSVHKIEHNKFLVGDAFVAINGSYNFTEPGSKSNSENCSVLPEPNAISTFKSRFEFLWEKNTEEKSKKYLAKILERRAARLTSQKKLPVTPGADINKSK